MLIKKIILLIALLMQISCKSDPKEMAKLNFTENVLINNPALHNYDIDQINEVLIFVTKDMKGVFSEEKLIHKSLKSYRLNHKESGDFLRSLNIYLLSNVSCSPTKQKPESFHIILVGKSNNLLGQFQIVESMTCPNKGFIITPGGVRELESWNSFESLLEVYRPN